MSLLMIYYYWYYKFAKQPMKRINKRFTMDSSATDEYKKLPNINQGQFSAKFNDLLERISVQNRYAARISHCNIKNLTQLEHAREQLKKIAEQKKMEQLKSMDNKEYVLQITSRIKDAQSQLQKLFKQIIEAKRQIKHLKNIISDLQNSNLQLQKKVLQAKRQKFHDVSAARQEIDSDLLSTHIGNFLLSSSQPNTLLYQFCLNVHKNNLYQNFFNGLDQRIQKQVKHKLKSLSKYPESSRISKIKLKLPKTDINSVNKVYQRYKTEHYERMLSEQK